MELSILDYKILKFVKKNPNCKKIDVINHFKNKSDIEFRFYNLAKPQISSIGIIENSSYIIKKSDGHWEDGEYIGQDYDAYYLSSLGEKVLSDYEENKFDDFKKSLLYPIIVSIITTYITVNFITK